MSKSRLPALFIGHGSPMNALDNNSFTTAWRDQIQDIGGVRAIVTISAHWLTQGTQVTAMEKPKTIHDFGGFPQELYQVQYPAAGSPSVASELKKALAPQIDVTLNSDWGLDHGTWSILLHMFPQAQIPVLQLSIDQAATGEMFFEIGRRLRPLREMGILFLGSGNIVHNLQLVDWNRLNEKGFAHPWAREADDLVQKLISQKKWDELMNWTRLPESVQVAVNSAEHYLPLLYILGLSFDDEQPQFFNAEAVGGALTMTSIRFG